MKRTLLILSLLLGSLFSRAEVVYTSPSNMYFTTGGYVFVDVNVDGINDYLIRAFDNGSQTKITVRGYNGCQVEAGSDGKAVGLSMNAPVGNNGWRDTALVIGFDFNLYYFPMNTSSYLGIKLNKNGQTYFGYITMNISGSGSLNIASVYNYAFEDVPNRPIFAGSIFSVNTQEVRLPVSMFWNGHAIRFQTNSIAHQRLYISDISGRIWADLPINQEEGTLPISLAPGIWVATLRNTMGEVEGSLKFATN